MAVGGHFLAVRRAEALEFADGLLHGGLVSGSVHQKIPCLLLLRLIRNCFECLYYFVRNYSVPHYYYMGIGVTFPTVSSLFDQTPVDEGTYDLRGARALRIPTKSRRSSHASAACGVVGLRTGHAIAVTGQNDRVDFRRKSKRLTALPRAFWV
jgi:hypothetical protein